MKRLAYLAAIAVMMLATGCGVVKPLVDWDYDNKIIEAREAKERIDFYNATHEKKWYDQKDNNWAFYTGFTTWALDSFFTFGKGAEVSATAYSIYRDATADSREDKRQEKRENKRTHKTKQNTNEEN
jgi:hypothetical protein